MKVVFSSSLFPRVSRMLVLSAFSLAVLLEAMPAAPLAYDSFATTADGAGGTYSATMDGNGKIYGQDPTTANAGFSGAWGNSTPLTTGGLLVETTGLTHALLQGTAAAGDVYAIKNTLGRTVTRAFDGTVDAAVANQEALSGEIWFSGLVAATGSSSGGAVFGLSADTRHDTAPSTGLQFGIVGGRIRLYNGATELGTNFSITAGLTYLVAVRIDLTAGGTENDSVTLEIYAPDATADSPTATISGSGLTLAPADLEYLILRQNNTGAYANTTTTPRFDEFRLGLSRGDVMVVPEPSSLVLLGIGLAGFWVGRRRR